MADTSRQSPYRLIPPRKRVATVGDQATFAHQASTRMLQLYPELNGAPSHFPSMDDLWGALESGRVDVVIAAEQTSALGWDEVHRRVALPYSDLYIQGAAVVPYACTLLVKPGTRLPDLDTIFGDSTIRLCGAWLDANLPGLPRVVHGTSLLDAAQQVAHGGGTKAVVAPLAVGPMTGLEPLAREIDGGAACNWWAISKEPVHVTEPNRLLISARFGDSGELGDLTSALWDFGFRLTTAYSQTTSRVPGEHDYLLAFSGDGRISDIRSELYRYADVRLVAGYTFRQ